MKWVSWYPANVGDRRIRTWFALWPVKIGNDCRWLESVTVEFEFIVVYIFFWKGGARHRDPWYYWKKIRFIRKAE